MGGITMQDVHLDVVNSFVVQVSSYYGGANPACAAIPHPPGYSTPSISDITVRNWRGSGVAAVAQLRGLPDAITENLRFQDFHMDAANDTWDCSAVNGTADGVTPPACAALSVRG